MPEFISKLKWNGAVGLLHVLCHSDNKTYMKGFCPEFPAGQGENSLFFMHPLLPISNQVSRPSCENIIIGTRFSKKCH